MSQLQQLKAQLNAIGGDARSTAGGLASFKSKFSAAVGQVSATIGGSAQRTDQEIIQTLQAAERQVDSAVQALQQAATTATRYAASL
jgi:hypothetical protein